MNKHRKNHLTSAFVTIILCLIVGVLFVPWILDIKAFEFKVFVALIIIAFVVLGALLQFYRQWRCKKGSD